VVDARKVLICERRLDMQRDVGFFNKFSGLDVLERIWKEDDGEEGVPFGLSPDREGWGETRIAALATVFGGERSLPRMRWSTSWSKDQPANVWF